MEVTRRLIERLLRGGDAALRSAAGLRACATNKGEHEGKVPHIVDMIKNEISLSSSIRWKKRQAVTDSG